jgi:hypothetical protein
MRRACSTRQSPDFKSVRTRLPVTFLAVRWPDPFREGCAVSRASAEDPFGDRRPTSHERFSGQPWDESYQDGPAPSDIDRQQQ